VKLWYAIQATAKALGDMLGDGKTMPTADARDPKSVTIFSLSEEAPTTCSTDGK